MKFLWDKLFIGSLVVLLLSILSVGSVQAQKRISWDDLGNLEYKNRYNVQFNDWYDKPKFGDELKKLDGKEVIIKGYMIPLDLEGKTYVISKFPNSSCFFCGAAGQETVVKLQLIDGGTYRVDEVVTMKGTLHLIDEIYELNFLLDKASLVKRGS